MMNQEIKQKWLEALRSGDYQQIQGALKSEKGYCCLGVLCEIHPEVELSESEDRYVAQYGYSINGGTLPEGLAESLGLSNGAVEIPFHYAEENLSPEAAEEIKEHRGSDRKVYLTNLNDHGVSFAVIADIIEKEF